MNYNSTNIKVKQSSCYQQLLLVIFLFCFSLSSLSAADSNPILNIYKKLSQAEDKLGKRPVDLALQSEWDTGKFKLQKALFILRNYKLSPNTQGVIDEDLQKVDEVIKSVTSGKKPAPFAGRREEAYYSDIDNSFQPFIRYLPESYDPAKKHPLIIYLHGYSPQLNIANWSTLPDGITDLSDDTGFCVAMPFGRSNTDFQGIGEQDVLNVYYEMQKRYNIDPDRIILAGMSMGGMGVWTIGSHYPHLFAALFIMSARGDYHFWHKTTPAQLPIYKRLLVDRDFPTTHLPNLSNIPIRCYHGTDDQLVDISEGRQMAKLLKAVNPDFKFTEYPEGDHWVNAEVFTDKAIQKWLLKQRRKAPPTFSFVTYFQDYNQAYWLKLSEFSDSPPPFIVNATCKKDSVTIQSKNISAFTVNKSLLPPELLKAKFTPEVSVDNALYKPTYSYLWGSIKDSFLQPFMFVQADQQKRLSNKFQQNIIDWYRYAKSLPRYKKENDLTDDDKKRFNIFLFGEPEQSSLIQEVLKSSPIKISKTHFIIDDMTFPRKGNGLYFRYKSPWNPEKTVTVQCGINWGKHAASNHKYDSLPGYIVYTGNAADYDPDHGNQALCAGFFNKNGKLTKELMYVLPKTK